MVGVLFLNALYSDVADMQGGTTAEGIHLGAMAGTIDVVQRCFTVWRPAAVSDSTRPSPRADQWCSICNIVGCRLVVKSRKTMSSSMCHPVLGSPSPWRSGHGARDGAQVGAHEVDLAR